MKMQYLAEAVEQYYARKIVRNIYVDFDGLIFQFSENTDDFIKFKSMIVVDGESGNELYNAIPDFDFISLRVSDFLMKKLISATSHKGACVIKFSSGVCAFVDNNAVESVFLGINNQYY